MPQPSNITGHLWGELHLLKLDLREMQVHHGHTGKRMDGFAQDMDRLEGSIEAAREEARKAVEEINSRINGAILWLAMAAGGLLLQLVGPKLGL